MITSIAISMPSNGRRCHWRTLPKENGESSGLRSAAARQRTCLHSIWTACSISQNGTSLLRAISYRHRSRHRQAQPQRNDFPACCIAALTASVLASSRFDDSDNRAIGRPQSARAVHAALERARQFPTLNIDLIYGQPGQTVASWLASLRQALRYRPEELYLYPLYVRPATGIGRHGDIVRLPSDFMRHLYRAARDLLYDAGYEQVSMRYFRKPRTSAENSPAYCCQSDGMIGLGCGARSYTSQVHYSNRFAVQSSEVHAILDEWMGQTEMDFAEADWGCRLSPDDRRRRFLIQSLLTQPGLDAAEFHDQFGPDLSELTHLLDAGFVESVQGFYRLTALGMEFSDAIGPSLYSAEHRASLAEFATP